MKRISTLILSVLFTGLFIGSGYTGITIEERSFDPQPEPPGLFEANQPPGSIITLADGRKLKFMQNGAKKQVYLLQKNGSRALADGAFTLPNGQKMNISKGVIAESK